MAMTAADLLHGQFRQFPPGKAFQICGDGTGPGLVDLQPGLHQPRESTGSDATNGNGFDILPAESQKWPACAVSMAEVAIDHFGKRVAVGFDGQKERRRAKVIEYQAVKPLILRDWKTDFHDLTPFFVYMHNIGAEHSKVNILFLHIL